MDVYLGQLLLVGFNFAPRGWMFCNGQLLSIAQNSALFSLLGTTYGGDGITTFALPNLQGRVPIGMGQGPGLSNYEIGEASGTETVTLTTSNMPAHNHTILAHNGDGNTNSPEGAYLAGFGTAAPPSGPYTNAAPDVTLAANAVMPAGGNQPFSVMQPFLTLNWIIAVEGIYPSRG